MITFDEILKKQKEDMSKYKVSICVTSYNQKEYITKTINSLLVQKTTFPFWIVIGDDCFSDGSVNILKEYKKMYPDKIKLILHQKNQGLKINCRYIFECCNTPYIAFCDGDDYWIDENVLQRKFDFLETNDKYIGYQSGCYSEKNGQVIETVDLEERNCFFDFDREDALQNAYPGQVGGFFFRNIFNYMSRQDFEFYEDIGAHDSGKLPILMAMLAPIYRQDTKVTFVYRFRSGSFSRKEEARNICKQIYISHLQYQRMLAGLGIQEKMKIDGQLMEIAVNSFITALRTTCYAAGKDNWEQFRFIYCEGYFTKKEIRQAIYSHIITKCREKIR